MKRWLLMYDVVDDFAARRTEFREEHLRLLREAAARGEVELAAAVGEFETAPPQVAHALLLFTTDDRSLVERYARHDPYVTNGLVTRWRVLEWIEVVRTGSSLTRE